MSLIKFSCMAGLLFVTAFAAAAPSRADKAVPPVPETLHQKLEQISQDPAKVADAVKRGQKDASVCRHCHGAGGNSVMPEVPNLASQNAAYLLEQMNKFALGRRKSSPFMEGMIKALAPDERVNIALFLSQQAVTTKPARTGAQNVVGKNLYGKLCINCHGASGTGTQTIPRLAGQQVQYLEDSLKRYRSGDGERVDRQMAAYTRNLKDADIRNLAAYLNTLQP